MVVIGKTVYRIASIASTHLRYKISLSKLVLNSRDKQKNYVPQNMIYFIGEKLTEIRF